MEAEGIDAGSIGLSLTGEAGCWISWAGRDTGMSSSPAERLGIH